MGASSAGGTLRAGAACKADRPPFDTRRLNVTKNFSSWTLAVAAAMGVMALAGCNQRESAQETAKDVKEARQDAQKDVADERREAADTANESAEDRASAEYDVAV